MIHLAALAVYFGNMYNVEIMSLKNLLLGLDDSSVEWPIPSMTGVCIISVSLLMIAIPIFYKSHKSRSDLVITIAVLLGTLYSPLVNYVKQTDSSLSSETPAAAPTSTPSTATTASSVKLDVYTIQKCACLPMTCLLVTSVIWMHHNPDNVLFRNPKLKSVFVLALLITSYGFTSLCRCRKTFSQVNS